MARPKVLFVANNHPHLSVGGAEVYTYDLYQRLRTGGEFEPIFLARTHAPGHHREDGSPLFGLEEDPNQVLWSVPDYDYFLMTSTRKEQYTLHFRELLAAYRPDLVHIHHTFGLGMDLIRQIRRTLPAAPIVYTLHEFLPICHAEGHMLRTGHEELCTHATPARCHECFPSISPRQFLQRERLLKSHLRLVDLFLCPSRFLLERYVEWGIPRDKLRFLENGRRLPAEPREQPATPAAGSLGFFGQITRDKGVLVLLEAIQRLVADGNRDVRLHVNGGNLERQPSDFRESLAARLEVCGGAVTFRGRYDPSELEARMRDVAWVVVPSIWWENSPLVIQEAFMHHRPVVCSNIGGMAEKVAHGVNGLHFRVGDAADLAATLDRASRSPDLWERLRAGIPPIFSLDEAVDAHGAIYRSLLRRSAVA